MITRAAILTACLLCAGAASAQEAPLPDLDTGDPATSGVSWTLGLGAVAFPDYQGSQDYTAAPLWNVRAQSLYHPNTYAQLLGPFFTSNLLPDSHFRLGPMAQFIRKRGSVDNNEVDDMQNVDPSFMLGRSSAMTSPSASSASPRVSRPSGRSQRQRLPRHAAGDLQDAAERDLAYVPGT